MAAPIPRGPIGRTLALTRHGRTTTLLMLGHAMHALSHATHAAFATVMSAAPSPPMVPREGASGMTVVLFQIMLMIAIFYFILIRPQQKEKRRHKEMLTKLRKGDRVMTNGGILGQIVHAAETELTIRTAENTRLVVDRGHIARKIEAS